MPGVRRVRRGRAPQFARTGGGFQFRLGGRFELPRGLPAAQLRVTGAGGSPAVDLRGPDGTQISVPLDGEQAANTAGDDFPAMRMDGTTVQIGLRKPAAGRWTVTPRANSAPIDSVAVAQALPAPKIRARVSGRGYGRVLRYRLQPARGRRVRFVEQAREPTVTSA